MVTGDWPRFPLLPGRWAVPLPWLAWPWLYLTLLAASFIFLASAGRLRVVQPTTADFLYLPIALIMTAFLVSVVFSQVPSFSWWAFGRLLGIIGFSLVVARIVEDDTVLAGLSIALAVAALLLAIRVIMWRFVQGSEFPPPFHIPNNAWLGKNQISWVLNLLAPLLLARFLAARHTLTTLVYGGAWFLAGGAIYLAFSRTGLVAFPLTTLSLCALNLHYWRRWVALLTVSMGLGVWLIAISPTPPIQLIASLSHPDRIANMVARQHVWRETVRMIADHPLTGIGLGTYDDVIFLQYDAVGYEDFFRRGMHAHNTHLHVLAETGAVGFLAWCYLWFTIARFLLRRWRDGDRLGRLNSGAALCVLLAFFVHSMTDALIAARVHAGLRMNLTLALLVIYGIRLAAWPRSGALSMPAAPPTAGGGAASAIIREPSRES